MRDNRSSDATDAAGGSSLSRPGATVLALEDDACLLALETQFNSLIKELIAAQKANDETIIYDSDPEARTKQMEAILARLHPIERAIMQAPVCTVAGLGVKARHAAYVMSQYWEALADQIDWDEQVVRLLIEAICKVAKVPLPS
jgi:hypothetical protein